MQRIYSSGLLALWLLLTAPNAPLNTQAAEQADDGDTALQRHRETRRQLAHRQRRIIFNNDGCDALYFPKGEPVTVQNFLAKRTTPLAGTLVDTLSYCTISSGFGFFTHRTRVGQVLNRQGADYGIQPDKRNIAQDLIDQGTDCLQAVLTFAHAHQMEGFWSMRMNDTHDAAHTPQQPYLLFPPLKAEHPDWLVGDPVKRTPYGRWSSVDYGRPEVRELAFQFIEEVCRNYDVDGVELDFFRHLCYFKSVAQGGTATQAERDSMTALLRRVRAMTEAVGQKRGRPILVMARTPDALAFNRDVGLDVERWLQEGLVDLLATTCYFRLNRWEESVALGHKCDVPVYPCLSDSRVKGESRFHRSAVESYRGQALEAWAAGADGIHLFNLFDVCGPHSPVFKEVGDPQILQTLDRLHFMSVRDGRPDSWLAGGSKYNRLPSLTPAVPKNIMPNHPLTLEIAMGDDFAAAPADAGHTPQITCHLALPNVERADGVRVKFNGHELGLGTLTKGWLDLRIEPLWVRKGLNQVEVSLVPSAPTDKTRWTVTYKGDSLPSQPWSRDAGSARTDARLAKGALLLADRGTIPGDYLYYRYVWGATAASQTIVEARVKVISGLSRIILSNGTSQERLNLWPDRIELWSRPSIRWAMDTTQAFHVYRIVTEGKDVKVFVDDQLRLTAPGAYSKPGDSRSAVAFGAADSTNVGEAWWEYVRAKVDSQTCQDLVLQVAYPKK